MPSPRSFARLAAFGILLVVLVTVAHPLLTPRTRAVHQPGPLVVVAMPTLRWADVDARRTPTLDRLARGGAIGNVATHAVAPHSCSRSVWGTLSAGFRVSLDDGTPARGAASHPQPCPPLPTPVQDRGGATIPGFERWRSGAARQLVPADLGLVAEDLAQHGQCVAAAGAGAALGAARRDGRVAVYAPDPADLDLQRCPVAFVALRGVDDPALARLVPRLPASSTLVVTGLADDGSPEELRAVLLAGPGIPRGSLTSASSHQPGLIRTTDLSALLVSRVSPLPDRGFEGRIPVVLPAGGSDPGNLALRRTLTETASALRWQHELVVPFFVGYVTLAVVAILVLIAFLQRDRLQGSPIRESRHGRSLRVVSAATAAVPVSTYLAGLVPWWRAPSPVPALVVAVLGWTAALTTLALTGPWRRLRGGPAGVLAAVTTLVLVVDLALGGRLQLTTMMGLQPVYGGRLHGLGNVGFALTASGALLAASLLTGRISRRSPSLAAQIIAAIGILTVVVDGHYALGDEAGGSLALVWGFGYLTLKASGRRTTWRAVSFITALSVLTGLVMATLDMMRPRYERSHIGDFLATFLRDGDVGGLVRNTVVNNWTMLTSQWVNLLVPVLLAGAAWAARHPLSRLGQPLSLLEQHIPLLRMGFTAIVLCWIVGFVTNDSGTSIPPTGMLLIIPLVVLMTACAPGPSADEGMD